VHFIDDLQVEIGYIVSTEFQGKGYSTEAVKEVIKYLFETLRKHRITASVDPRNLKSIKLLDRIGMRKEAYFKKSIWFNNEWTDDVVYAILEEEYRK
jgi:RimJ/RimL family protein N-acetyltransferase